MTVEPKACAVMLDSIDTSTLIGKRDRALIATMVYSFGRISAVVGMNVEDSWQNGKRCWLQLCEQGCKQHEVPAPHNAEEYLDLYVKAAGIGREKNARCFAPEMVGPTG